MEEQSRTYIPPKILTHQSIVFETVYSWEKADYQSDEEV